MTTWYTKDLGDGVLAGPALDVVESLVKQELLDGAGQVAAFTRHVSGDLHCSVLLYLTPAASGIAESIGAHPCGTPARSGLTILAGQEEAWELI